MNSILFLKNVGTHVIVQWPTVKILRASIEALFIFFTLLSCCLMVRQSCGEDTRPMFYQEANHCKIVARGCTVQWSPVNKAITQTWVLSKQREKQTDIPHDPLPCVKTTTSFPREMALHKLNSACTFITQPSVIHINIIIPSTPMSSPHTLNLHSALRWET